VNELRLGEGMFTPLAEKSKVSGIGQAGDGWFLGYGILPSQASRRRTTKKSCRTLGSLPDVNEQTSLST
jgi:hypothetical protein